MVKVKIYPGALSGIVNVPSSKSMGHREIICAALAQGISVIDNISMSDDIKATLRCLKALGVQSELTASRFKGMNVTAVNRVLPYAFCCRLAHCAEPLLLLLARGAWENAR